MKKKYSNKLVNNQSIIVVIALFVALTFMTTGFALYGKLLTIGGTITVKPDGKLVISYVSTADSSNVLGDEEPEITGNTLVFDITFGGQESEFYIVYNMRAVNNSSYDYTFNVFDYDSVIEASGGGEGYIDLIPIGISQGDVLRSGTTKDFQIKIILTPSDPTQTYGVTTTTESDVDPEPTGQIIAVASPTSIDLTGNNDLVPVTVEVLNTYPYDITFTPRSSNGNFSLAADSTGTAFTSLTIPANSSENQYTVYVKKVQGAIFETNSSSTSIILDCGRLGYVYTETITIAVDIYVAPDTDAPHIGTVTLTASTTMAGEMSVSWSRTDQGGTDVQSYHVLLYRSGTNGAVKEHTVSASTFSDSFTDLYTDSYTDGTYYAVVYGIDEKNDGKNFCNNLAGASTNNEYCRMSESVLTSWIYTVSYTGDTNYYSSDGGSRAALGKQYKTTLSPGSNRSIDNVTIRMNNRQLSQGTNGYTKSGNTYTINKVTGPITINVTTSSTTCLAKGTKILMADGKYKNIESVKYNDLLAVWNYDTGSLTYTYPAFIENETLMTEYTKTTFSDGSVLKTHGSHGIFSYDLNRYILTTDTDNYKVGSRIVKIENGNVKVVSIKKIETIHESVMVYHIVSTGYFNIIANDVLTTDPNIMISNQYGFVENVKWPSGTRENIINDKNNLYDYDLFADIMPYYMYKALRVDEGKYVVNQGMITFDLLKLYLASNPANSHYFNDLPKNSAGKRLLMVTTSLDNVTLYNKSNYTYEEGSYYTLPVRSNVKCYLYTINNTCYAGGTKFRVDTSMHFIAVTDNKENITIMK